MIDYRGLKRGSRFEHKDWTWVDADGRRPAVFEVTRLAQGVVYYKIPGARRAGSYFRIEEFDKRVARVLP